MLPDELEDLAKDVDSAERITFYKDLGDRFPDSANLSPAAKKLIAAALRYHAQAMRDAQARVDHYRSIPE